MVRQTERGTDMPRTVLTRTYAKLEPFQPLPTPITQAVQIAPAASGVTNMPAGTVMGIETATGWWVPYDPEDTIVGSGVAKGILVYPITVNAEDGNDDYYVTITDEV